MKAARKIAMRQAVESFIVGSEYLEHELLISNISQNRYRYN
jgi:hypothetical protein